MNDKRNRRSIRLPDWDYRAGGIYFVTICTYNRIYLFDDPRLHELAVNAWDYIPNHPHAAHVTLDERVVMPNHAHGLLWLAERPLSPTPQRKRPSGPLPESVGAIIGNYKMLVTKRIKAIRKAIGSPMQVWQRGYWERIVRNERELNAIRKYIRENPARWADDPDNLDRMLSKMRYVDDL